MIRKDAVALIPAHNEEKYIGEVLNRAKSVISDILVIDDGSKDRTYDIAKKAGVRVIRHEVNKGKGEALKTGFEEIKKNFKNKKFVVIIDADLQMLPEEAPFLLEPLEKGEADFVLGYRKWDTVPLIHRVGNIVWKNSFNLLFGTDLKDTNCGFAAMTLPAMEQMEVMGGYIIENHMLATAVRKGLKIKQVPVTVSYHRKSGIVRGIRVVAGVLFYIWEAGIKYRLGF